MMVNGVLLASPKNRSSFHHVPSSGCIASRARMGSWGEWVGGFGERGWCVAL